MDSAGRKHWLTLTLYAREFSTSFALPDEVSNRDSHMAPAAPPGKRRCCVCHKSGRLSGPQIRPARAAKLLLGMIQLPAAQDKEKA